MAENTLGILVAKGRGSFEGPTPQGCHSSPSPEPDTLPTHQRRL